MQGVYRIIGVLVAGGDSKRISNDIECASKVLIKVNGESLIRFNMRILSPYVDSYIVIVGKAKHEIMDELGDSFDGKPIAYITQPVRDGPLGAIRHAQPFMDGKRCIVALADEYVRGEHIDRMILASSDSSAVLGVIPNSDKSLIANAYSVSYRDSIAHIERGIVEDVVEKPTDFPNDVRGTGYYVLCPDAISIIPDIPARENGQYEITDLFPYLISHGCTVRASQVADEEYNINTKEILDTLGGN